MEKISTIAVCIPTFNQAAYLSVAVRSVFAQSRLPDEVWISDDCSTDDTPAVAAALQAQFPSIKYIRQERNLGMGGNPNWLMRQPKTEFIAKLDSDDFYEPRYLERLLASLQSHPRAGYAHAAVWQIDDAGNRTRCRVLHRKSGFVSDPDSLRMLKSGYRVAANIIVFRRQALERVDFWKADMAFADDFDLAVRIADAGWGNCYVGEILANYRVWSDAGNYRARRKLSEINGLRRVFEESLTPAYVRRGWSLRPLCKTRQAMAAGYVRGLHTLASNSPEQIQIVDALFALGSGYPLRFRLFCYKVGLGPVFEKYGDLSLRLRDWIKRFLKK